MTTKVLNFYELLGHDDDDYYPELEEIPLIRFAPARVITHVKGPQTHLPATRSDKAQARVPVELAYFEDDEDTKRSNNLRSFYRAAGVKRWDERARIEQSDSPHTAPISSPKTNRPCAAQAHGRHARLRQVRPPDLAVDAGDVRTTFLHSGRGDDGTVWGRRIEVYLTTPRSTGLSALYAGDADKYPLPGFYLAIEAYR